MNKAGLLASIFAAAGLYGCVDQPVETSSNQGISFEEYKARAAREPGTGAYVVEWDLVLHGEQALYRHWESLQQGALTIYNNGANGGTTGGTDIKWSATQKKQLTYCIGNSFGANKQLVINAMQAATAQGWEKLADVKFVYLSAQDATCTAANPNVVFDVNLAPAGSPYLARAFFPDSPRAERNVLIDSTAYNYTIPLSRILIHEAGHVLGFRHEHVRAPGNPCPEDQAGNLQYRQVTAYDVKSTMHYPQCGSPGNTLELSPLDAQGVAAIYGPPAVNMSPMANITLPMNGQTVGPNFTVSAAVIDTDLVRAELLIDGAVYATKTTGPFDFQVTSLAVGQHQLELRGVDGANQTSVSMITVTVASGGGGGNGTGGGNGDGTGGGKDDDGDGSGTDVTGGCSTGGGGAGLLLALGLVGLVLRRRR